jgi:hypothetical protein
MIIAGAQEARGFLLRFRGELWPDIPVIFGGMDERGLQGLVLPPGTAAITTRYDEERTLRAALALLPDTQRVALVGGTSKLDHYLYGMWLEAFGRLERRPELIELSGLPLVRHYRERPPSL